MTFRFPIEIAKDLVAVIGQFSKQSLEVHGIGLVSVPLIPVHCRLVTNIWFRRRLKKCLT